jgi:hypothetical protein
MVAEMVDRLVRNGEIPATSSLTDTNKSADVHNTIHGTDRFHCLLLIRLSVMELNTECCGMGMWMGRMSIINIVNASMYIIEKSIDRV